jgi:hypothetical protein
MKDEINIPVQFNELREEDLLNAAERRRKYSIARDQQAEEYNEAIASRLAKEKVNDIDNEKDNGELE